MFGRKRNSKFSYSLICAASLVGLVSLVQSPLMAAETPPKINFDADTGQGSGSGGGSGATASGARKIQFHLDGGISETAEKRVSPVLGMAIGVTLNDNLAVDFDMRYRTHFGESPQNNSFNFISLSPILRTNYELWDGFSIHNVFGIGLGITTMKVTPPPPPAVLAGSDSKTTVKPVWTLGVGVEQALSDNLGLAFDIRLNHIDYRKGYLYLLPDSLDATIGASFSF